MVGGVYDLIQLLSGHGGYRMYLCKFGLDELPRRNLENELNSLLTVEILVSTFWFTLCNRIPRGIEQLSGETNASMAKRSRS